MKKIIFLAIINFLPTIIYADITQKQLDEYLEISRGGEMLRYIQYEMAWTMVLGSKTPYKDIAMKTFLEVCKQKRYTRKYTKDFKKITSKTYFEIMSFYKTSVGKKSVNIINNYTKNFEYRKPEKYLIKKFSNIENNNLLTYEKLVIINKLTKIFDTINIKRNLLRYSVLAINDSFKTPYKYTIEEIEKKSTRGNPNFENTTKKIIYFYYKDLTEEELQEILNYASSDAGKQEYELILKGSQDYIKTFMHDAVKAIHPKISK